MTLPVRNCRFIMTLAGQKCRFMLTRDTVVREQLGNVVPAVKISHQQNTHLSSRGVWNALPINTARLNHSFSGQAMLVFKETFMKGMLITLMCLLGSNLPAQGKEAYLDSGIENIQLSWAFV